jgi:hypothetical protein
MKLPEEAMKSVRTGLQDPYVTMGDRTNLEQLNTSYEAKTKGVLIHEDINIESILEGNCSYLIESILLLATPSSDEKIKEINRY